MKLELYVSKRVDTGSSIELELSLVKDTCQAQPLVLRALRTTPLGGELARYRIGQGFELSLSPVQHKPWLAALPNPEEPEL